MTGSCRSSTLLVAFLPLAGALLLLALPNRDGAQATTRPLGALASRCVTFVATLALWAGFDAADGAGFQFVERHAWMPTFGIDYYVGVDGISLMLLVLTTFLTPLALLSSWEAIEEQVKAFSIFMLLLETAMIGRVRLARPVPVLRVLGRHAHPDVLPDRDLGLRPARLRRRSSSCSTRWPAAC